MKLTVLCDRYLEEYAKFKKSYANDKWMVDTYIRNSRHLPKLVPHIEYEHVDKLIRSLRDTPYLANRVRSVLSMMFTLAERWNARPRDTNPCTFVNRFPEQKRHRYLTDEEIRKFIVSCETLFAQRPKQIGLLLLLLYTGARCGEIQSGKRSNITGTEWHLDDSKTGQGIIFLTPQALAVLNRLPVNTTYPIGMDVNPRYAFASVCKLAGISNFRIHDLRHCFASIGLSVDIPLDKISPLLRHASPQTTKRYAHLVPSAGRAAALAIGEKLESLIK